MSDKFEDFIRDNSDEFNDQQPFEGHEARFLKKLEKRKQSTRSKVYMLMRVAAVFVMAFGLGYLYNSTNVQTNEMPAVATENYSLEEIAPEVAEAETYYQQVLTVKQEIVEDYNMADKAVIESYLSELDLLEGAYDEMRKELVNNYRDERIINSMIINYRTRVEILEALINQLEDIKNGENEQFEQQA